MVHIKELRDELRIGLLFLSTTAKKCSQRLQDARWVSDAMAGDIVAA